MATIRGLAAPFLEWSANLGGFRERIARGAFARTLREGRQWMLHHHNMANVVGSTDGGTLRLYEGERGLMFELDAPDTTLGSDLVELVGRGDIAGVSIGFSVRTANAERWWEGQDGMLYRELRDIDLTEISTTAIPAYPTTSLSVDALTGQRRSRKAPKPSRLRARRVEPWQINRMRSQMERELDRKSLHVDARHKLAVEAAAKRRLRMR